jgi:hypothetical protein
MRRSLLESARDAGPSVLGGAILGPVILEGPALVHHRDLVIVTKTWRSAR